MSRFYRPYPHAIVDGYAAYVLAAVLRRHLDDALEEWQVPPDAQPVIREQAEAIRRAGDAWRHGPGTSANTSPVDSGTQAEGPSPRKEQLPTVEVAEMLNVTAERVRQLAREGRLGTRVGGRWAFSRSEVLAYRDARDDAA